MGSDYFLFAYLYNLYVILRITYKLFLGGHVYANQCKRELQGQRDS